MEIYPLEQFKIHSIVKLPKLFGHNIDFTNSSLFMMISIILTIVFLFLGTRKTSKIQEEINIKYLLFTINEYLYNFIISIIKSNIGDKGIKHISLIFTVFIFTLSCNLIGIFPYSFTVTSHIIVTFSLSMIAFIYTTIIGLQEKGIKFFTILFLPKNTPCWLAPMIIIIKVFTYLSRPISLSIRLATNMIAGHTIIKVIAGFVINMNPIFIPIPFLFIILLIGFEIFVAILQAYIFTTLTCIYLSDAVK